MKLNGLRELTLQVSEMPTNQECQPDITCEQLPLQFSFRDLFTTRQLACRSCCLGKFREAQRSGVVRVIVLEDVCSCILD